MLGAVLLDYFSSEYDRMTAGYSELKLPLLIIWGREDSGLSPALGNRLQGAVSGASLKIIPQAGHNVHQEQAAIVNSSLLEFLAPDR